MVIADLANHVTGEVFASLGYLEDATGLSKKTVLAGIESLIGMGILERTDERKGRTGQIPVYIFEMAEGVEVIPKGGRSKRVAKTTPLGNRGKNDQERGDILPEKEGQKRHTEPSIRNQVEETENPHLPSECTPPEDLFGQPDVQNLPAVYEPTLEDVITKGFIALKEINPAIPAVGKWSEDRKKAARARAKSAMPEFGATEIEVWTKIFDAVKRDRWLMGKGKYTGDPFVLTLTYLLRPRYFIPILEKGSTNAADTSETHDPVSGRRYSENEQAARQAFAAIQHNRTARGLV